MSQQRGPFPEGTAVSLKHGGPLMTVEDFRTDGMVATVWFADGQPRRDAFHPDSLIAWVPFRRLPACG